MTEKIKIVAYISAETKEKLTAAARAENRSISNYIECLIEKACHEGTPEANKAEYTPQKG